MEKDYQTLEYEKRGEIGILTLNRPKVVNAIDREMLDELNEFWQDRKEDFEARVIVLKGSGEKGFCSGLDLKAAANLEGGFCKDGVTPEAIYNSQNRFSRIIRAMRECPQPIIAAVHGHAMGAGLSYALASDIRIASPDAVFCAQYINIGTGGADMGSSYFLWRIVGWGRAAEICMTGRRVGAEEALRIGLVNNIYPKEELFKEAVGTAEVMVGKSKMGLRLTKDALNAGLNTCSLEDANRMEDRNQAFFIVSGLMDTKVSDKKSD